MKVKVNPGLSGLRATVAVAIGNVFEWYDFVVYSYFAVIIAARFFPAIDETASLLAVFATFGVGFIFRPLGAVVIGAIGDRKGRKTALVLTIMLMACGTLLIGLVPSYETIGIAAPIILVIARLLQGFSVGGEWGTSILYRRISAFRKARSLQQLSTSDRRGRTLAWIGDRRVARDVARLRKHAKLGLASSVSHRCFDCAGRPLHAPQY
jgi:MFS family permease